MEKLEIRVKQIEERNKRVELDKKWEISFTRRVLIVILTYIVISVFFLFAQIERPFVNSIVPSLAFVLSTLSMPLFKKIWIKYK